MKNSEKIKLLILTPSMKCGGSEKFVSTLCNNINTEKFEVRLAVINNDKAFYNITNQAIEVVDLQKNRVLFSLSSIKQTVNNFQPDIIFSTANHLNLYLSIFKNQFKSTIKFIAREASIVSINSQQAKMPVLYNWLIKNCYHRFDCIVCQSTYMQQDLIDNYKIVTGKTVVIHNTVEAVQSEFIQPREKNEEREYKFLTVSRLTYEKGVERLIHAVGLISVPFKYYIIGDGNKKTELQKLINELHLQDNVFLLGEKTDPFAGMQDADLFLLGSYYEGFPNVLLEAGTNGIPVIAFNVPGGIAEIIKDKENGILVPDNDIIAFGTAIKKGIGSNFKRHKIIETTKKRYGVSRIIPAVEKLFIEHTADI